MWAGIAASNLLGVTAGTVLGHASGWRANFWAITTVDHRILGKIKEITVERTQRSLSA
jgi:predicted MFS family arabinose efflux permease